MRRSSNFRGNRKSGIGNPEIWDLEIGQARHLKAEIRNLKLDLGDLDRREFLSLSEVGVQESKPKGNQFLWWKELLCFHLTGRGPQRPI